MRECAVVNASPLIYLSKIDRLPLLQLVASRVLVPQAVMAEIAAKGQNNVTHLTVLQQASWLIPQVQIDVPGPVLAWDLGAGESAVIATALSRATCPAIILAASVAPPRPLWAPVSAQRRSAGFWAACSGMSSPGRTFI